MPFFFSSEMPKGKYEMIANIEKLSIFQRRQVLLFTDKKFRKKVKTEGCANCL